MLFNLGDNKKENGCVKWVTIEGCIYISNLYILGVEKLRGVTFFDTVIHKKKKKNREVWCLYGFDAFPVTTVYPAIPLLLPRNQEGFLSHIYFISILLAFN